ncbi:hypothetical protein B9T31_14570 [Acinetobacter sp. ANC 4558]|uniref:YbgF trimerization domain-containing protein n=1 Tax=Acinetobacter sp. ANC 4558 TaxID=1977876 RepID=UPI000A330F3A|nr:YbgF trimerization domain-containing protein [Acinetobacter sp. ANC 4558]OTG82516.1 hypothetical protein B9T31_14570 [Acinetobacter sp. ANC 4558]
MMLKNSLSIFIMLCSSSIYANVPIESRGLSNPSVYSNNNTATAINIPNTPTEVPTNINWQLTQKAQQLENDIRVLRGKIEEQDNEINQLKNELNNRYTDLDQRLELVLQKLESDTEDTISEEDNQKDKSPSPTKEPIKNAIVPSTAAATTQKSPTVSINNNAQQKTVNPPSTAATASPKASDAELDKAAYTVALEAYKQGGAKKALAPMQNFIKNNPNSVYISNAYFWVAEFYLAIEPTNYIEAKKNFEIVMNKYPNSSKAANAVYRLYSISLNVDQNSTLANKYKAELLKKYPNSEEAGFLKNKKAP